MYSVVHPATTLLHSQVPPLCLHRRSCGVVIVLERYSSSYYAVSLLTSLSSLTWPC